MRVPCGRRTAPDVVVLDFGPRTDEVVVTSDRSGRPAPELLSRIRSLLDLDTDAAAVAEHLAQDPALAAAVGAAPGVRIPGSLDGWELLLRTMVGQQISLAAARTHLARPGGGPGGAARGHGRLAAGPVRWCGRGART